MVTPKRINPFFSTASTMARIKHECSDAKGPKKGVQEVSNSYSGVYQPLTSVGYQGGNNRCLRPNVGVSSPLCPK